jgi:hypothetical protein
MARVDPNRVSIYRVSGHREDVVEVLGVSLGRNGPEAKLEKTADQESDRKDELARQNHF